MRGHCSRDNSCQKHTVTIKLVGMFASIDFVLNYNSEVASFIYNENINVMPLTQDIGAAKVYAIKIKGRFQEVVQE